MYITLPETGSPETRGTVWHRVQCEVCDTVFVAPSSYTVAISYVLGRGRETVRTIDSATISRHAQHNKPDPAPCPECYHFQTEMRDRYAAGHFAYLQIIGGIFLLLSMAGFAILDATKSKPNNPNEPLPAIVVGIAAIAFVTGVTLLLLPVALRRLVNPNREHSLEKRKELSRSVFRPDAFRKAFPDALGFNEPDEPPATTRPPSDTSSEYTRRPLRDDH